MMTMALIMGTGEILPAKDSTGSIWVDLIQFISLTFSSRAAKLGMIIMIIGGFSKYMDAIGASTALVRIAVKPLQKIGQPYLVLALTSVLGNFLAMFISSCYISQIERGLKTVSLPTLMKIADVLNVEEMKLLDFNRRWQD